MFENATCSTVDADYGSLGMDIACFLTIILSILLTQWSQQYPESALRNVATLGCALWVVASAHLLNTFNCFTTGMAYAAIVFDTIGMVATVGVYFGASERLDAV